MNHADICDDCGYEFAASETKSGGRAACPHCGSLSRTLMSGSRSHSVMGMTALSSSGQTILTATDHIQHRSDYQIDWEAFITSIDVGEYAVEPKTLTGDAPKALITLTENGLSKVRGMSSFPSYVAKVGIKKYPNESITEQLNTRIAEIMGLTPARSVLCVISGQVRFLSNYFLKPIDEQLLHGVQILEAKLGEKYVREVAEGHLEREHYTFQILESAIKEFFPDNFSKLLEDFVRMLLFDALIGLHDRHHGNWGIITGPNDLPRFAPFYDNARALFWNWDDAKVIRALNDETMMHRYVQKSFPQMSFDGIGPELNHFDLLQKIATHDTAYNSIISDVLENYDQSNIDSLLKSEFAKLMSPERHRAISACLALRHEKLTKCVL